MNWINFLGAAIDIGGKIKKFSDESIMLANGIFGALSGLAAVAIILYAVKQLIRRHDTSLDVQEEAKKNLKKLIVTIIFAVICVTLGFTLINTLMTDATTDIFPVS